MTKKRCSCDPAQGAAPEQHVVLEQVSSGQCQLCRGKLPLLSCHAKGHVPAGHGISIGSCGTSSITCALPCPKEEVVKELILQITTFCLSMETQCGEGTAWGSLQLPRAWAWLPCPCWVSGGTRCPGLGVHSPVSECPRLCTALDNVMTGWT